MNNKDIFMSTEYKIKIKNAYNYVKYRIFIIKA